MVPLPVLPQPCLSIRSSLSDLTTVPLFILVSLLLAWTAWTAFCGRLTGRVSEFDHNHAGCTPLASPEAAHWVQGGYPSLVLHNRPDPCLPRYGRFVGLPLALRVPATSARQNRASFMFHLLVPLPRRAGALSVVGPLAWNGLPLALRSLPRLFPQKFLRQLKTTLFGGAVVGSASE